MPSNSYSQYSTYYFHFLPSFLLIIYSILALRISKFSPNRMNRKSTVCLNSCMRLMVPTILLIPPGQLEPPLPHQEVASSMSLYLNPYGPQPNLNQYGPRLMSNSHSRNFHLFSWHAVREPEHSMERPVAIHESVPS